MRTGTALWLALAAAACGRAPGPAPEGAADAAHGNSAAMPAPVSDSDASIAAFEAKVAGDPRDDASRAHLGVLLLRRHEETGDESALRRAESLAREALALRPASASGVAVLARSLSAQGRHVEAVKSCRESAAFRDGDLDVLCALADATLHAGLLQDAANAVDLLLARGDGAATLLRAARLARKSGDSGKAAEIARRAAAAARKEGLIPQEAAAPLVEEGRALLCLGKFDDAAKAFDSALEVWPRSADAWLGRAGCDLRRERRAEALAAAKKAAAIRDGVTERALVVFLSPPTAEAAESAADGTAPRTPR